MLLIGISLRLRGSLLRSSILRLLILGLCVRRLLSLRVAVLGLLILRLLSWLCVLAGIRIAVAILLRRVGLLRDGICGGECDCAEQNGCCAPTLLVGCFGGCFCAFGEGCAAGLATALRKYCILAARTSVGDFIFPHIPLRPESG